MKGLCIPSQSGKKGFCRTMPVSVFAFEIEAAGLSPAISISVFRQSSVKRACHFLFFSNSVSTSKKTKGKSSLSAGFVKIEEKAASFPFSNMPHSPAKTFSPVDSPALQLAKTAAVFFERESSLYSFFKMEEEKVNEGSAKGASIRSAVLF